MILPARLTAPFLRSVCLISIIRIVIITRLEFSDVPYEFAVVAYWGAAEVYLAIICACLTTLKPFLVRFFPALLGTTHATATYDPNSAVRRTGVTASVQRTQVTVKDDEERCFTRLDDDSSDKSADIHDSAAMYELDQQVQRGSYLLSPVSKAHLKLGLY